MSCHSRLPMVLALIAAIVAAAAGCKSKTQKEQEEALRYANTPLPHDPTDNDVLAQWWSNGQQLLRLQDDHAYALYDNNNRYSRPRERGRWDQDGYAVLWLDPYTSPQPQRTRVGITKIDGRLALLLPGAEPLSPLGGPPPAREDQFVGSWQGSMGSLQLNANMTYSLEPATGAMFAGRPLAGHSGRWKLSGGEITLTANSPGVTAVTLKVRDLPPPPPPPAEGGAGTVPGPGPDAVLEGLGGELIKVKAIQA